MILTPDAIIAAALACLDTPFQHQARVPGLGLDCAGLYVTICRTLGLPHQDAQGYPRNPYDGQLEKNLDAQPCLRRIDLAEMAGGDLLAMRIERAPQHIAIHTGLIDGHPYIVHASELHGKVCRHRLDELWGARVLRAYRFEVPL